jgi:diaminohydroxyphosphoribosylaminopyrimidine deaminase/5-amino-6-(5-phosphoribosylamino)uracil reductase
MVGAVVVAGDRVVGQGWHERFGEPHAEVNALREAGEAARGATVYVTLEPCAHHGKTPPCTDALIAAGVARVVCAVRDPSPRAAGGAERLERAGIPVTTGVEARAARELNAAFFHDASGANRPFVTVKLALTLDAAVADARGHSKWITGPLSRREVHRLRAGSDAIAVGIETVLADDPTLTVRGARAPRVPPRRVVFDRRARLPNDSRLARSARELPVVVVCGSEAAAERIDALTALGIEIVRADDLPHAMMSLRQLEVRSLLVEGGGQIASAFLDADLVDRLIIFQAPILLGAGATPAFGHLEPVALERARRFEVLARKRFGSDLMTVYAPEGSVHRAD